ncbi:MAG: hypothetical protein DRG78_12615 [Epsilonproteobacteria bacterium]|nr:MAG: hypothetical protein DRG78_12615 [Campylobacterota bacterium]
MRIFLIFISLASVVFAIPTWYYNIQNTKQNNYIGYGSASSEQEAKQNALVAISGQIDTKIDSELKTVKSNNTKRIEIKSSQTTKSNLSGYELLKMSFEDGKYFVAIEYENIPRIQKFKNKLKAKNIKVNFDNYLKQFELVRKDKNWYIKYQDIMQVLDTKDLNKFFITISNKNLTIATNKKNNILYDGDEFYFKVKSAKKGFVTIFTVYEDGTVSTLLQNILIDKNSLENLPDKDFEAVPQAGLMEKGVKTFDMYVAIYSTKKMILDNFARADEELIDDARYKNFDELVEFIKDKTYTT